MWYHSVHMSRPISIRKLRMDLCKLVAHSDLQNLSHLHVCDCGDNCKVKEVVLPPNLIYCYLEQSKYVTNCTLPLTLKFLESKDFGFEYVNLDNHPNITVLRVPTAYQIHTLPPNMIELEFLHIAETNLKFLKLLTSLKFGYSNYELPCLPNLNRLDLGNIDCLNKLSKCEYVKDLSFTMHRATNVIGFLPNLCPQVVDLKIHCSCSMFMKFPVFQNVQKLTLKISKTADSILALDFRHWPHLVDLSLDLDGYWSGKPPNKIPLFMPPNLVRLKIQNRIAITLQVWKFEVQFPVSLTRVDIDSFYPVFEVSIPADAKLRTLRTVGNVFSRSHQLNLPQSLKLFHAHMFRDESLYNCWNSFPDHVDFQIFYD